MEILEKLYSDALVHIGADVILAGLKNLRELADKIRFDGVYRGAEDFWYRGLEKDRIGNGAYIKIEGLLSPLGPYMPSNPRAKPGYSAEGWMTVTNLLKQFLKTKNYPPPDDPLSSSDYDSIDLFIWGDSVIRQKPLLDKKIYAGLYNQYGKAFECIPVFLDAKNSKQKKALDQLDWFKSYGGLVSLEGYVNMMPSFYSNIVKLVKPYETPQYPCFSIEVNKIKVVKAPKLVLYASAWASHGEGQVSTEFFDFMDNNETRLGLERLKERSLISNKKVTFYYDFLENLGYYPEGNREVDEKLAEAQSFW